MWQEIHCREYQESLLFPGRLGIFQGDLGPLSNRSVVETCILPVLMYECESWILLRVISSCWKPFREKWPNCCSYSFGLALSEGGADSEEVILFEKSD